MYIDSFSKSEDAHDYRSIRIEKLSEIPSSLWATVWELLSHRMNRVCSGDWAPEPVFLTTIILILKEETSFCQQRFIQSKLCFFPAIVYGCESCIIKKAECWRIYAFKLWCWRWRLLRVPWTARRSNQSIPKEIRLEYSLEELKLKLQYLGHPIWRTN